ncbi:MULTISPECIES: MurR/RpiR family transcriptional regulator [Methylobacterium]|uniref:MurR/RpiR family transcriptional regulator n=1 Tax=Methylobacterium TaxID=407 RepID=UPI0013EC44F2|nr:MurR/RpiR family transcriptional regulator [Methylobacterium sp. DB0501]NGM34083.1 MurR/RpiR family transcriptional regulator [Methylobacterium sp. DB0501]
MRNEDEDGAGGNREDPPRTIEALRALALDIGRDEAAISLGTKAHGVLARLVGMPEQAAVRSITELAALLDVNASTLTRLAKRLGFLGFSDFQSVFRDAIADDARYFYSRQVGRLLKAEAGPVAEIAPFARLAEESAANVQGFLAELEPAVLAGAAQALARARRVRVHGVRQFHALASFLAYGLGLVRSDIALLDAPRLGVAEALAQLEPGDVVVVASCAPYTRSVARVAEVAAAGGLAVIAITDTRSSPLAGPARHAFFIPHTSSFYSNSMAAYVVFAEGLLNLVARELGEEAATALAERERWIGGMNVEM